MADQLSPDAASSPADESLSPVARPQRQQLDPVLPSRAAGDEDSAWGDTGRTATGDGHTDDWFLTERPPHHEA